MSRPTTSTLLSKGDPRTGAEPLYRNRSSTYRTTDISSTRPQPRILELTGISPLVNYIGDYDYYLEKERRTDSEYMPRLPQPKKRLHFQPQRKLLPRASSPGSSRKEEQARIRKRQNELKKTEERIHVLEVRDKEIDDLMMQEEVFTNVAKCVELNKEKTAINEELETLYERWEELAE